MGNLATGVIVTAALAGPYNPNWNTTETILTHQPIKKTNFSVGGTLSHLAMPTITNSGHSWISSTSQPTLFHVVSDAKISNKMSNFSRYKLSERISDLESMRTEEIKDLGGDLKNLSKISAVRFWNFIERFGIVKRPSLFLQDNGELRATWRANTNKFSLQFFESNSVHFVLYLRTEQPSNSPVMWGIHDASGALKILEAHDLLDDFLFS